MKKHYLVVIEFNSGARSELHLTARNHTAAGDQAKAIIARRGFAARLVSIGETE